MISAYTAGVSHPRGGCTSAEGEYVKYLTDIRETENLFSLPSCSSEGKEAQFASIVLTQYHCPPLTHEEEEEGRLILQTTDTYHF